MRLRRVRRSPERTNLWRVSIRDLLTASRELTHLCWSSWTLWNTNNVGQILLLSYWLVLHHTHITVPRLFSVVSRHCFVPIAGVVRETYSFGALSANHVFLSQPMRAENSSHVISQLQRTSLFDELRWWTTWSSHVIYQLQESRLAV